MREFLERVRSPEHFLGNVDVDGCSERGENLGYIHEIDTGSVELLEAFSLLVKGCQSGIASIPECPGSLLLAPVRDSTTEDAQNLPAARVRGVRDAPQWIPGQEGSGHLPNHVARGNVSLGRWCAHAQNLSDCCGGWIARRTADGKPTSTPGSIASSSTSSSSSSSSCGRITPIAEAQLP